MVSQPQQHCHSGLFLQRAVVLYSIEFLASSWFCTRYYGIPPGVTINTLSKYWHMSFRNQHCSGMKTRPLNICISFHCSSRSRVWSKWGLERFLVCLPVVVWWRCAKVFRLYRSWAHLRHGWMIREAEWIFSAHALITLGLDVSFLAYLFLPPWASLILILFMV